MKKKILIMVLAIWCGWQSRATGHEKDKMVIRQVELGKSFDRISVSGGVVVMLIEDESTRASVQGDQKYVDAITLEVQDGELLVGTRKSGFSDRAVVYVPVQSIRSIRLKGLCRVYSLGKIQATELVLKVDGDCDFGLSSTGKITIIHPDDYEVTYQWADSRKGVKEMVAL